MKNYDNLLINIKCIICGHSPLIKSCSHYYKCSNCDHEIHSGITIEPQIINDQLSLSHIESTGMLDKFKNKVLRECIHNNFYLIDFGSSSGKFLWQNKRLFQESTGVEVTQECIDFCRENLNLHIVQTIAELENKNISVATFWHSLEHIPYAFIDPIFSFLNKNTDKNSSIIISVPNSDSPLHYFFKENNPYYDSISHYHNFSSRSLNILMHNYGYQLKSKYYSGAYSIFGYLQALINLFNKIHNFLYYYKKRGARFGLNNISISLLLIYNTILTALFILPSIILSLHDFFIRDKGGVITRCYKKVN